MRMSYEEMAAFLERPLVASFVTLRADGSPEVAPVWYQFADGDFIVYTSRTFRRVRNIERDSRVVISIAPHDAPYAYVTAEGRAVIARDGVAEAARAITERYMQGQAAEDFLDETLDDSSVLLRFTPERLITWVSEE